MTLVEYFKKSIAAGIMIGIGSIVKLSYENNLVGAVLFSIGLFIICSFDFYLYTGKIGYALSKERLEASRYILIWIGNLFGCLMAVLPYRMFVDDKSNIIENMMNNKLLQSGIERIILAFMCGVLMYLAVNNFKTGKTDFSKIFGVVICVSTFIICGFEHSIADICYSAFFVDSFSDLVSVCVYIADISVWNGIGAIFMQKLASDEK